MAEVKRTVGFDAVPPRGTSSVSRSSPNSRVRATMATGTSSPRRLPTRTAASD